MANSELSAREASLFFLIPGIVQGLALYYFIEFYEDAWFFLTGVQFLLLFPLGFFLTARPGGRRLSALFGIGIGAFVAGLTCWAQTRFGVKDPVEGLYVLSSVCGGLIFYIAVPFFNTVAGRRERPNHYPSLFEFAWNIPFILAGAVFFVGLVWAVLALWSGLFKLLTITFFYDIFFTGVTFCIVTAGAGAMAVGMLRTREKLILALRGVLFMLFRVLTPILTLACLLFVLAAFTHGLDDLWSGWSATFTMLTAISFAVTVTNAVIGDRGVPDNRILLWSTRLLGVVTLFLAAFAVVGIGLRIAAYGLTVDRFYAALVVFMASLYAMLYGVCAVRPGRYVLLRQGNIILAGGIFVLAVLVQTPLLDAYRLSATSQLTRLVAGAVSVSDFDYAYARFEMGKEGEKLLKKLEMLDHPEKQTITIRLAEIRAVDSASAYRNKRRGRKNRQRALDSFAHVELIGIAANFSDDDKLDMYDDFYKLGTCNKKTVTCIITPVEGYDALRISHIFVYFDIDTKAATVYYYPGPKADGPTVGRHEIVLTNDSSARRLLTQLRQGPVFVDTVSVKAMHLGEDYVLIPKLDNAHPLVVAPTEPAQQQAE